jgi:tRNA G37 N-methylase TrmD
MTTHTIRVTFHRDDREHPIIAGERTFHGEDYQAFDERAARERLIADGDLVIGDIVTFGGTIAPLARIDRVVVEVVSKSRPPAAE